MRKKYLNNLITSLLIISFVFIPYFSATSKVKAQALSVSGYTSGLANAITTLPLCKSMVDSGIKSLFSGVESLLSSSTPVGESNGIDQGALDEMNDFIKNDPKSAVKKLNDEVSAAASNTRIDINLPSTTEDKLTRIEALGLETKKATASLNANDTCLKSIGKLIIKMLLQKLTKSTVDWINNGFDGSPAFIQDPGKFFGDIAKTEILQFGIEIRGISPFSEDWIKNQALAYNKKFADNAKYSLNELIQDTNPEYSASTFQADFSQGGWNAWTAMTQVPANNPLGFKLMADNEMQKRLAGTTQSTAQNIRDALQEANGFLGDQRCADPKGTTREEDSAARARGKKDEDGYAIGACKKWEYVTPGKMISDAATNTMGFTKDSYLNVNDLNDAVAAVLDALLSQFTSNIIEKGFANFSNEGADGSLSYNSSGSDSYRTQTENDFTPTQLTSSWLQANPDFNIRTDLTQALIDEQRTYSDKLALQNKELLSTTDGGVYKLAEDRLSSNTYGLIPAIHQLDYCIPGPHPGWEEDTRETLNKEAKKTLSKRTPPSERSVTGSDEEAKARLLSDLIRGYYALNLSILTGYFPNPLGENDTDFHLESEQQIYYVLDAILDRYSNLIYKFYNQKLMPIVLPEATSEFNKLNGYNQMVKNNEDKIASLKIVVTSLIQIKKTVEKLNKDLAEGTIKNQSGQKVPENEQKSQYEENLKVQINAFGRMSDKMVNGNDIANVDNLVKQIIDEKNYVYNDLIKGPYGCEKDLESKQPNGSFPQQIYNTKRMTYPLPILYDYNFISKDSDIPDPWKSGFVNNKMTFNTDRNAQGPGFLSYVFFQQANVQENDRDQVAFCPSIDPNTPYDWCMIELRDLVPLGPQKITLGKGSTSRTWAPSGQFEKTIGIY